MNYLKQSDFRLNREWEAKVNKFGCLLRSWGVAIEKHFHTLFDRRDWMDVFDFLNGKGFLSDAEDRDRWGVFGRKYSEQIITETMKYLDLPGSVEKIGIRDLETSSKNFGTLDNADFWIIRGKRTDKNISHFKYTDDWLNIWDPARPEIPFKIIDLIMAYKFKE